MRLLKQRHWHELFEAGVTIKALNSAWETLAGIFLLTRLHNWFTLVVVWVSKTQLLGDRDDVLFHLVQNQVSHLGVDGTRIFVGVYLLFHGLMNAFLSYNLFRNRLWAYPVSMAFTSVFFVYQIYRLSHTHSGLLLAVSVFDVIFIFLTWHEYQHQLKKSRHAATL